MKRPTRMTIALLLTTPMLAADAARAQPFPFRVDVPRYPDSAIKFNLSTPGARSLAMGGAFIGLADDATAAYTNPAGLTNLALGGSEVAVEARGTRFTTLVTDRGHYPTQPGGGVNGYTPRLTFIGEDSVPGLPLSEVDSETSGLSFLSYGHVLPGGLTIAAYRHELGNFRNDFESQGPFNDDGCFTAPDGEIQCTLFRVLPRRSMTDLEIVNFGVSAGYGFDLPAIRGLESNLSIGVGISFYDLELEAVNETFDLCHVAGFELVENDPNNLFDDVFACAEEGRRLAGAFYGPADFSRDNHVDGIEENGDDQAFGFSFGFLWRLGRQQRWSIGGVFRQGPDFNTSRQAEVGHHVDGPEAEGPLALQNFPLPDGSVTVPDVFGLGVAFRTAEGSTKVTLDVNRTLYSQTLADFSTRICVDFDFTTFECIREERITDFVIPDVTQIHMGVETTVLVVESLFVGTVRIGAWHEPYHEPTYSPAGDPTAFPTADLIALLTRPGKDETHFSAGLGLVIKEDYQIDFALDYSDPVTTFSASLVKFF